MTDFNVTVGGGGLTVQLNPQIEFDEEFIAPDPGGIELEDENGVLKITIRSTKGNTYTAQTRVGIATGGIPSAEKVGNDLVLTYHEQSLRDTGYLVNGDPDIPDDGLRIPVDDGPAQYPLLKNDVLTIGGETFTVSAPFAPAASGNIQIETREHVHLDDNAAVQVNFDRLVFPLSDFVANDSIDTDKIADDAVSEPKLAPAVRTKLNADPDVTQAEFDAEQAKRVAGDMLTAVQISTEAALTQALAAQATSDEPLRIHFTAEVVHSGTTYAKDQISYVPPRSNAIENEFILPQPGQGTGGLQSVATDSTLDGDGTTDSPLSLANGSVSGRKIQGGVVASGHLVNSPIITTTRIFRNAVNGDKIAENSIGIGHMRDAAVGTAELVDSGVTEGKLAQAVRDKLNAEGGVEFGSDAGEVAEWAEGDNTDRLPNAKAPQIAVDAKEEAVAAQLATDTVIKAGPAFAPVARGTTSVPQRNLYVSIEHPANAYRNANIMSVAVQGLTPNLQAYNPGSLQAEYTVGLTSADMDNLASQGHFAEGNYILVEVRLMQGRNGPLQFFRNIFVPVEAVGTGGGLSTVESDATLSGDGSSDSPLRVTNPFTDADEQKLDGITYPVPSSGLEANSVTVSKIATNAVGTRQIAAGGVGTSEIGNSVVTEPKLSADVRAKLNQTHIPIVAYAARTAYAAGTLVGYNGELFFTKQAVPDTNTDAPVDGAVWEHIGVDATPQATADGQGTVTLNQVRELAIDEDTVIYDDPDSPTAPSADNADKVLYSGGRLYRNVHLHSSDPVVSYRDFATSDLPGGFTYRGVFQVSPSSGDAASRNSVIYSTASHRFLRRGLFAGSLVWGNYNQDHYIGAFDSESEADQHVTAVGDVVFYGGTVRVVTAYTARVPDAYVWEIIEEEIADNSIAEAKLDASLRFKINEPDEDHTARNSINRLIPRVNSNRDNLAAFNDVDIKTASYTIVAADLNKTIVNTGPAQHTFTLPDISTLPDLGSGTGIGWSVVIVNHSTTESLALNAATGNTIESGKHGPAQNDSITVGAAETLRVVDSTSWVAISDTIPDAGLDEDEVDARINARVTAAQIALFARRNPTSVRVLTYGRNIVWDTDDGLLARATLTGNATIANPTNVQIGDVLVLILQQDSTGSRTVTWGSNFHWPGDTAPDLSTDANARDVATFLAIAPNQLIGGPLVSNPS